MQRGEGMWQKSFETAGQPSPWAFCHPLGPQRGSYSYGQLWKEVTPSALQWENPQEAEYAWTGRDALEMSLLPKPLQALSPMLKASHPS